MAVIRLPPGSFQRCCHRARCRKQGCGSASIVVVAGQQEVARIFSSMPSRPLAQPGRPGIQNRERAPTASVSKQPNPHIPHSQDMVAALTNGPAAGIASTSDCADL